MDGPSGHTLATDKLGPVTCPLFVVRPTLRTASAAGQDNGGGRSGLSRRSAAAAMAMVAAGGGEPVEPQSLKKLSLKSLKRSLDLFAPAHSLLFSPDAER